MSEGALRFPGLLVIGAMKAGSTTLFRDLEQHPDVYFPIDKEPENLTSDDVLTEEGRQAYARLFRGAGPRQMLAEASTAYTKRPDFEGVAERAKKILPDDAKFIYLVRDPVQRAMSHYRHEAAKHKTPPNPDTELRGNPAYVEYSRYDFQLEPWLETFGPERVKVVVFEEYTANREIGLCEVMDWLDLEAQGSGVDPERIYNNSASKPVVQGPWKLINQNPVYRSVIRPLMSADTREKVRNLVLPKAPKPPRASDETRAWLAERLEGVEPGLRAMLGREAPIWPAGSGERGGEASRVGEAGRVGGAG